MHCESPEGSIKRAHNTYTIYWTSVEFTVLNWPVRPRVRAYLKRSDDGRRVDGDAAMRDVLADVAAVALVDDREIRIRIKPRRHFINALDNRPRLTMLTDVELLDESIVSVTFLCSKTTS